APEAGLSRKPPQRRTEEKAMTVDRGVAEMAEIKARFEAQTLPESLGAFVRSCAELHGDKIVGSWFDEGITLTYRALDEAADRLAASLVGIGVRKGTHFAVMLPHTQAVSGSV